MKYHSIILFFAIIIAQNAAGQSLILDCIYKDYLYMEHSNYEAEFQGDYADIPSKLLFSPMQDSGWEVGLIIDSKHKNFFYSLPEGIPLGKVCFSMDRTKIDVSEKELVLFNDKNQKIVLYVEKTLFSDSTISGYIRLKEGWDYDIGNIKLPYKESNIIDGFHKLVKQISKVYTQKSATCDNSIIGLINNPLGIDWGDSWRTPFNEFLPVAERFYGGYNSSLDYFSEKEYNPYTRSYRQNFSIDICGQKVNSIGFRDAYLHYDLREDQYDKTKYIKSTEYNIYLYTPKAFKKNPQFNKKEECIWNKELSLDYCNKIKQELDLMGCNMQKIKSKSICKYEGMKNGKVITLNLSKIGGDFFCVSLGIANKTKEYDFYIVWD